MGGGERQSPAAGPIRGRGERNLSNFKREEALFDCRAPESVLRAAAGLFPCYLHWGGGGLLTGPQWSPSASAVEKTLSGEIAAAEKGSGSARSPAIEQRRAAPLA